MKNSYKVTLESIEVDERNPEDAAIADSSEEQDKRIRQAALQEAAEAVREVSGMPSAFEDAIRALMEGE